MVPIVIVGQSLMVTLLALALMAGLILMVAAWGNIFSVQTPGARPLQPGEFSWLQPMVAELAGKAGIDTPRVLLAADDCLNAYATGIGSKSTIVFYRGLLRRLTTDEVRTVAAHELGHVINRDISLIVWAEAIFRWVLVVRTSGHLAAVAMIAFVKAVYNAGDIWYQVVGFFLGCFLYPLAFVTKLVADFWTLVARALECAIFQQREYLADATAVALTGQPETFANALAIVAEDSDIPEEDVSVAKLCIMSPVFAQGVLAEMTATHPDPWKRIDEVRKLPAVERDWGTEWKGIGSLGILLPAGAVLCLGLISLFLTLLMGGGGGDVSPRGSIALAPNQPVRPINAPPYSAPRTNVAQSGSAAVQSHSLQPVPIATSVAIPSKPLAFAQPAGGTIAAEKQVDRWTFQGQKGQIVTVTMSQEGGQALGPSLKLIDPSGQTVKTASLCSGGAGIARILNYELGATGTYALDAESCRGTGSYSMTLSAKAPAREVAYGVGGAGSIALPGDYEDWLFSGRVGDIVTIRISQAGGASLRPFGKLVDPSGATVASASNCYEKGGEGRMQNVVLKASGTYRIRIEGGCQSTGGYGLALAVKPQPGKFVYGQAISGKIAVTNDYDDWQFQAQAGEIITIRMLQEGGESLPPKFVLLDPSGAVAASMCSSSGYIKGEARVENLQIRFSGTYTLRASGCFKESLGGYRLLVSKR